MKYLSNKKGFLGIDNKISIKEKVVVVPFGLEKTVSYGLNYRLDNYLTLVCDFHTHSVFSDGSGWPDIRVEEAQRDKIDVLAVTVHLEYQPHISDIPHPDRNRSYQLATKYSNSDLLIVSGAEITRRMPLGHANAIFLEDANKLHSADEIAGIVPKDDMRPFKAANKQKAFVFWNHPTWRQEQYGDVVITEMHKTLFSKGYLHGVEVVNEFEYSEESLQILLEIRIFMVWLIGIMKFQKGDTVL